MLTPHRLRHHAVRTVNFDPELTSAGVDAHHVVPEGEALLVAMETGDGGAGDEGAVVGGRGGVVQIQVVASCDTAEVTLSHTNTLTLRVHV